MGSVRLRLSQLEPVPVKTLFRSTIHLRSEMVLDVAAGVDWTAIVACMMAVQQVGVLLLPPPLPPTPTPTPTIAA